MSVVLVAAQASQQAIAIATVTYSMSVVLVADQASQQALVIVLETNLML
jgi:hypothetical protein